MSGAGNPSAEIKEISDDREAVLVEVKAKMVTQ